MDNLTISLDIANKKGICTSAKAVGAYSSILMRVYNFPSAPDLSSLRAVVYLDNNTVISTCTSFVQDGTTGIYDATVELSTDNAMAYFSAQKPSFIKDLALVIADSSMLYCNSPITVKNNPNAIPISPTPVTTWFVVKSDEGFTADLEGQAEVFAMTDSMTAAQVRRGLITLTKYLHAKGVI